MRESRTSGSVRGARGNPRPYRDRLNRTRKLLMTGCWFDLMPGPVLVSTCDDRAAVR